MYNLLKYDPATNELSVESKSNDDVLLFGNVRVKLWFTMKEEPFEQAVSDWFTVSINECLITGVTAIDQDIYYAYGDPALTLDLRSYYKAEPDCDGDEFPLTIERI